MPDLCDLEQVKQAFGISDDDSSQDDELQRLITATSLQILNEIRRPDLYPSVSYTDRLVGNGSPELFLKHYPVNSITSVTVSGTAQDEFDGTNSGWFFDPDAAPEDRQKVILYGSCWPRPCNGWAIPNIVVEYNAGYDNAPEDIVQAVIEWIGFKRGFAQLQAQDQSSITWQQIGATQEAVTIGTSTLKQAELDMPESVRAVIENYMRSPL